MAIGTKRMRGSDEYIFVDGKAMRSDEVVRIELEAPVAAPGQVEEEKRRGLRSTLQRLDREDAFELREDAAANLASLGEGLWADDRKKMRRKYLITGLALLALFLLSCCISTTYNNTVYNLHDVVASYYWRVRILITNMTAPAQATKMMAAAYADYSMLFDAPATFLDVLKIASSGVFLAIAGMLYQNAFRNPIAAPSMLGISNGTNIALLVLVMIFGADAAYMKGAYYAFSLVGGALVLALVLFGGKYISGRGSFNVVNMLLMGTIISQLLGVIIRYVQTNFMDEATWLEYYNLQAAVGVDSIWTYVCIVVGLVLACVPIVLFRFRLNLISFSDEETQLLGVDPGKLRFLALGCGSLMMLVAQVNAGQVSMVSLLVPFVVRALYGAEFRKQLLGNIICGAFIMLLVNDISSFFDLSAYGLNTGSIMTIVAFPAFVWMVSVRQRSWE